MKKQLLLGSALLAALIAFPQSGRVRPAGTVNLPAEKIASKFAVANEPEQQPKLNIAPVQENTTPMENGKSSSVQSTNIGWKQLCGSMNTYGMLVNTTRPLQYNDNVNAVSFIHRKSASYTVSPSSNSNSGSIIAEISSNWGTTWDSTALYADASNAGRYPQGAIYSAPGNTLLSNAYIVGSGPVVSAGAFVGDFYASKKLNVFNNAPDVTPNAQQFVSFAQASYPANFQPHSWSRTGFTSTDDGVVRSLALIQGDNTTLGAAAKQRGVGVVKGVFNAGVFNWTMDSLIPNALLDGTGAKNIGEGQMSWNESGTVGYVVIPGVLANATGNNIGLEPIIYKTTNSGSSWAPLAPIDFNSAAMAQVVNHLYATNANTNVTSPYMLDFNLIVDGNDNLHIAALFASNASTNADSIGYIQQFTVGTDVYKYTHTPGDRPYLYDFVGNGTAAWSLKLIDSMWTEDPGGQTTSAGYNDNPWDPTGTGSSKLNIDARIQLGRTPNGKFVTYSWSESDTNFTTTQKKYNILPNIKARCAAIGAGTSMTISPTEINVSKIAAGQGTNNPQVNSRATLHYMSPTTSAATVALGATTSTADVIVPFTVTNSNPYSQLTSNITWYSSARLSFAFNSIVTEIGQNASNSVVNSSIYPNPASNSAVLAIDLKNNTSVSVSIYNTIGQLVKSTTADGQVGNNNINIDLANLSSGVYIVNVKAGNAVSTKKLIVE
ncbi:MAG: T9SS type A sorting domain-containing protein [Bacteroidetes bacterium]|nr:T9SS type A sorting domain-containing protein [Bacteroidota bacterium]